MSDKSSGMSDASSIDGSGSTARFSLPVLIFVWLGAFLVANVISAVVFGASGAVSGEEPIWVVGLSALGLWIPFLGALWAVSVRLGSGSFVRDYAIAFRSVDLVGIPIGVASQLVFVNLVYLPLRAVFPDTFSADRVENRARDLFDRAHGGWLVVLILVVVVGAPIVEEIVYRGFINGSLQGQLGDGVALVVAAAWFALIHFAPVEYPGLFVFAIVLGLCFLRTRRLGLPIMAHMAFNATGLILVAGK